MINGADFLSAYRTNPHVDQFERGQEAGRAMRRLFAGEKTARALVQLPFIPPSTTLNTDAGPYGRMMDAAVARAEGAVWNVSLCSGFSVGDSSKAGVNVTVTADTDEVALRTARDIAQAFWDAREEFNISLTPVADAVALMASDAAAHIYGDVADNPGGGGRGNTLATLKAMLEGGVTNAIVGMLYDPALAAEAATLGEGATFEARFNRAEEHPQSGKLTTEVRVLKVADGMVDCRRGLYAGSRQDLGVCALLECDGVLVIISSIRRQLCDPAFIERFGLEIADFQTVVVKSRGHFRAGFDEYFPPERVVEIDGPGLTTPVLSRIPFKRTPRPIHPLDAETVWCAAEAGIVNEPR
jgi:microcystin degradation protein MlrC